MITEQIALTFSKPTDKQRVLDILLAARGDWVPDLYRKTHTMVHSRIADLRRDGHRIEAKCFGAGDWRYRIVVE